MRSELTGPANLYVRTDGNDANNGSANDAAHAKASIQAAVAAALALDTMGFPVSILVADGTYAAGAVIDRPMFGGGSLTIAGNAALPGNVYVNANGETFVASRGARVMVRDLKVRSASGNCLSAIDFSRIDFANVQFGQSGKSHLQASEAGAVCALGDYFICPGGGASSHAHAFTHGRIALSNRHLTFLGGAAFSAFFLGASDANVSFEGFTWSGPGAAGPRYRAHANALIDGDGLPLTFLPGNAVGTLATGGQIE